MTKKDFSVVIDQVISQFGSFQKFLVAILCLHNAIAAIYMTLGSFQSYTPPKYICVEENLRLENDTCVPGCRNYIFNKLETSIVTEWSLICDRRYLLALSGTIFFVGVMLGGIACGIFSDKWGRRFPVIACLYLQGIIGAGMFFVHNFNLFMVMNFAMGFFVKGLKLISFTVVQEVTPSNKLTVTGFLFQASWQLGMIYLGVLAYFIRDWRMLQLFLSVPTLLTLGWFWLIQESPKWYLAKNRKLEALNSALSIARGSKAVSKFDDDDTIEQSPSSSVSSITSAEVPKKANVFDIFTNGILLKHIFVLAISGFSSWLSYFVILLYLPRLPRGRHMSFIIGALLEICGHILAFLMLRSRLGRRYTMIINSYITTAFFILLAILVSIDTDQPWKSNAIIGIGLLGKAVTVALINGNNIMSIELFPTVMRGTAIGICHLATNFGSLVAPQFILLGERTHPGILMVSIAVVTFIGGSVTFVIPETLNKKLPNTLEDVEETWGR